MTVRKFQFLFLLLASVLVSSCNPEFDTPPGTDIPTGDIMTIADLRAMYTGVNVSFDTDKTVYGVVISDERNGNFYKEAYLQDGSSAIYLRLLNAGGLYAGDSIRLNLNGTTLTEFNGMLQVDSVDVDRNIVKQATLVNVTPSVITIDQIDDNWESQLVELKDVQFVTSDVGQTFADPINLFSENRTLEDCFGNQVLVRTSGFSNFAGANVPSGGGSFVGVLGEYRGDWQLYIRNLDEVLLDGDRCGSGCPAFQTISEDFTDVIDDQNIAISCWTSVATKGSRTWYGTSFSGNSSAEMEAYQATDPENEAWLITPGVEFGGSDVLSFETAMAFWDHDGLEVMISTDFDGIDVNAATWSPITCTLATSTDNFYDWIPSGSISISSYVPSGFTGNYYIGFKYAGTEGNLDSKYQLDNVQISK